MRESLLVNVIVRGETMFGRAADTQQTVTAERVCAGVDPALSLIPLQKPAHFWERPKVTRHFAVMCRADRSPVPVARTTETAIPGPRRPRR